MPRFYPFWLLFSCAAAAIFRSVEASQRDCNFPAVFNFGDSNSDTGGLAATFIEPPRPYGETFFGMPAGRFSDGRLVIDFVAKSLGLPYLDAYLDSIGTNFSHGANFATAASTVIPQTSIVTQGGFSPFYLDAQVWEFIRFKNKSRRMRLTKKPTGIFHKLMPKEGYFTKGLYTIDIGANDLGAGFNNFTVKQVKALVPDIVNNISAAIKNLYNSGARSFWIHNTGPIGCLPYIIVNLPPTGTDAIGCGKGYNDVAGYFNLKLKEVVLRLRDDLPLAAITYVDIYTVKYKLLSEPHRYGFERPFAVCCGYGGGKYNYSLNVECGGTVAVNGTRVFVGSCKDPSTRVSWDGVHYTEAAQKFIFDRIATGAYSDPPVPLRMACHRNVTQFLN